jgi:spoIIIJ-associated protein
MERPQRPDRGPRTAPPPQARAAAERSDLPLAPPADAEDEVDFAGRTLRDILTLLDLTETEIAARAPQSPGDGLGMIEQVFDIYGSDARASDDLGVLIGRHGDTLMSLQYLLNTIVRSRYGTAHPFGVDVEEYRARRERSLVEMAKRVAEEVRATGDVITLEPMRASERRIIHLALEGEEGVRTESVGEGEDRQIEVLPE